MKAGIRLVAPAVVAAWGMALPARAGDTICFEAEIVSEIRKPVQVTEEAGAPMPPSGKKVKGASGGKYLEIPQGKGNPPEVTNGVAIIRFDVAAEGKYYLWGRTWWEDSCGNSFTLRIDDGKPFGFGQDGTYARWHWVRMPALRFRLSKGTHTLQVINREDGARLDQVLFTTSKRFVPVGVEDSTTTPHAPAKD